jgi:anti-sigma factor RsiW
MEKIPRLSPEQRSDLVAYLDGELPDAQVREINQVLARNPVAQHDVDMLARTWELLDELPRLNVAQDFTARTLTAIKVDAAPQSLIPRAWIAGASRSRGVRRGAILAAWVVGLAASAAFGFTLTSRLIPEPNEDLLRNLAVIEKIDLYANIESVDFLNELKKRNFNFEEAAAHDP